jgi:hypothetical protein
MKILLLLVAATAAVILCVVAIGALVPKRHVVSRSAVYRAAPEELFALIAGPQNWRPEVSHCEILPGTDGREMQRETTSQGMVTYEILDRVPPMSLRRRIATPNLPYSGTWTFALEGHAASTTVRITEDGEVYNPVFRFVSRFVLGQTRTMDNYLRSLGKATGQDVVLSK